MDVAEDNNEVGLVTQLGGILADGFDNGQDVPGSNLIGRRKISHQVAHQDTDDSDADSSNRLDDVWPSGEKGAAVVYDVRGDDGKFRGLDEVLNTAPAVIEFVIAES